MTIELFLLAVALILVALTGLMVYVRYRMRRNLRKLGQLPAMEVSLTLSSTDKPEEVDERQSG